MQVCELAVHRGRRILERNSDAVILEVRRRLARPCLEGSKSRNRLSETCAWPVLFWVSAKLHHLTKAGTMFNRMLVLGPAALLAAACSIDGPNPSDAPVVSTATVAFSAVKFWEAGATVSWNKLATDLAVAAPAPGINAARLYAYLALAQFRAAEAAEAAPGPHPPIAAAIGGASVAVLSSFFPGSVTQLEAALDAQEASDPWPGAKHADFVAGEATGRAVGARVLTFAQSDLVGLTNPVDPPIGPPPVGAGNWIYEIGRAHV